MQRDLYHIRQAIAKLDPTVIASAFEWSVTSPTRKLKVNNPQGFSIRFELRNAGGGERIYVRYWQPAAPRRSVNEKKPKGKEHTIALGIPAEFQAEAVRFAGTAINRIRVLLVQKRYVDLKLEQEKKSKYWGNGG